MNTMEVTYSVVTLSTQLVSVPVDRHGDDNNKKK